MKVFKKTLLEANKAINAFNNKTGGFLGGITGTVDRMRPQKMIGPLRPGERRQRVPGVGFFDAVREAHKATGNEMSIGGYSAKKIAGSYIAASAAGRIATGGGIYKDKDGNTDVIGIPLI